MADFRADVQQLLDEMECEDEQNQPVEQSENQSENWRTILKLGHFRLQWLDEGQ